MIQCALVVVCANTIIYLLRYSANIALAVYLQKTSRDLLSHRGISPYRIDELKLL